MVADSLLDKYILKDSEKQGSDEVNLSDLKGVKL